MDECIANRRPVSGSVPETGLRVQPFQVVLPLPTPISSTFSPREEENCANSGMDRSNS
jgi:hypothetical protein